MSAHKKFTKQEISKILAKASEIQLSGESGSDDGSFGEGISKEELLQIAQEVGISQTVLENAINQVENQVDKQFNWLIGNSELQASIILDGEATDLQVDQVIPELNTFTGQKGTLEKVGNSYDWEQKDNDPESIRRITIIPKNGKTKVMQYVNWNELRFLGLGLSALLGSIALMILLKSLGLPKSTYIPFSPLGGLVSYFGFMGGLKYVFNRQKKKFETIMQLVTDSLERPAQHRINLDELPEQQTDKQVQRNKTKS